MAIIIAEIRINIRDKDAFVLTLDNLKIGRPIDTNSSFDDFVSNIKILMTGETTLRFAVNVFGFEIGRFVFNALEAGVQQGKSRKGVIMMLARNIGTCVASIYNYLGFFKTIYEYPALLMSDKCSKDFVAKRGSEIKKWLEQNDTDEIAKTPLPRITIDFNGPITVEPIMPGVLDDSQKFADARPAAKVKDYGTLADGHDVLAPLDIDPQLEYNALGEDGFYEDDPTPETPVSTRSLIPFCDGDGDDGNTQVEVHEDDIDMNTDDAPDDDDDDNNAPNDDNDDNNAPNDDNNAPDDADEHLLDELDALCDGINKQLKAQHSTQ